MVQLSRKCLPGALDQFSSTSEVTDEGTDRTYALLVIMSLDMCARRQTKIWHVLQRLSKHLQKWTFGSFGHLTSMPQRQDLNRFAVLQQSHGTDLSEETIDSGGIDSLSSSMQQAR